MQDHIKTGIGFGLTSATITTLALMIGLYASTGSRLAVLSGILIIAIADALSDAFGIHMSEESKDKSTEKEVWLATLSTFVAKLVFASTFIVPVLLFKLTTALIVNVAWGLIMLSTLSVFMAKNNKESAVKVVLEHACLAMFVVAGSYYLGELITRVVN